MELKRRRRFAARSRVRVNNLPRPALLPRFEFADGFDDVRETHRVNLEALADGFEQRDGELAAEMFAR